MKKKDTILIRLEKQVKGAGFSGVVHVSEDELLEYFNALPRVVRISALISLTFRGHPLQVK